MVTRPKISDDPGKFDKEDLKLMVSKKGRAGSAFSPGARNKRGPIPGLTLENGLTPEQEAYARMRAYGMSQHEAISFATQGRVTGNASGSVMEKKFPIVVARINELTKAIAEKIVEHAAANKGWVMSRLMKIADRCMQAEPVMDKEGEATGEYKFDAAGANRSLELLGKELGMFAHRLKLEPVSELEQLSNGELTRIAKELVAQIGLDSDSEDHQAAPGLEQAIALPALR